MGEGALEMGDREKLLIKRGNEVGFNQDNPELREKRIGLMIRCGRCGWNSVGEWKPCNKHKEE